MKIDQYIFFYFSLSQWSGKVAVQFDKELGLSDKGKTLHGVKRICPQEVLDGFIVLDKCTKSYLDKVGLRFRVSNLWCVDRREEENAKVFLKGQEVKFHKLMDELRQNYDSACDKFFDGKEYEDQLRKSKKNIDDIISAFAFNYHCFQLDTGTPVSNPEPGSLFSDFVHAVAKQANDVRRKS